MNTRAVPLMVWVAGGLLAIAVLPFATTVYQISQNQDSLVKQVQQTHLVSVTATAQKISNTVARFTSLLASIEASPSIVANTNQPAVDEILSNALLLDESILAVGVFRNDPTRSLRQLAQKKAAASYASAILFGATSDALQAVTLNGSDFLIVRRQRAGSDTELLLLVDRAPIQSWLKVPALDDALLGLQDQSNQIIDGRVSDYQDFPESLRQLLDARYVGSAADNYTDHNGTRQVAAFARVDGTDWVVISQQPADKAEIARQEMWQTAMKALLAVFTLCCLLALAAHMKVVRPIRDLVRAQKELLGTDPSNASGSEIAQLKQAFASLEEHIRDREKLRTISLGRYQINDVIASGAMGTVFRGWDPRLERMIAIKTIKVGKREEGFERRVLIEKLVTEAKLVARITHPNIVTVYDAVDTREMAFIAMELVEGISLKSYLSTCHVLAPMQTVALASGILRGLAEAHGHGIIHRDIKAGNVLLGHNKSIKLSDFGLASIVGGAMNQAQTVLGTPGYIAPEIVFGGPYSETSDIFAVGVLLYRCLVGFPPFRGSSVTDTLAVTTKQPAKPPMDVNPDVPEPLSNAVMSLLIKDPLKRPGNALMVAESIERALGVHKWEPTFPESVGRQAHPGPATPSTVILPDTIVQKHLRTADD